MSDHVIPISSTALFVAQNVAQWTLVTIPNTRKTTLWKVSNGSEAAKYLKFNLLALHTHYFVVDLE